MSRIQDSGFRIQGKKSLYTILLSLFPESRILNPESLSMLTLGLILSSCSLAPDFMVPETAVPEAYKEDAELKGKWKEVAPLEQADRGQWWKIFGDEKLDALEAEALAANQSLKAASARVEQSRAIADAAAASFLPNIDIGANAVRAKPGNASVAAFGGPSGVKLKPYTLYSAQGVVSYEADLFGRVRDSYHALESDAVAQEAAYRSAILALQADVAQNYYSLRALDAERQLLRDTAAMRSEGLRIMQRRYDLGAAGEEDFSRSQADVAAIKAELLALDQQRARMEHALAVLLGKLPSEFTLEEAPLSALPPAIPAGLPSTLLQRRPDIAAAASSMAAANDRIGVARAAFFPIISLTASGGFESLELSDLFRWSSRTWALGQVAGSAITMPIFDSGRNLARLDVAHSAYEEAVANYRQQVLVAFRDVEDELAAQRLLAEQSAQTDMAAATSGVTTALTERRYEAGDTNYFEVVNTQRNSLAAERAAVQTRGQRFLTTIALIRALGGGWDEPAPAAEAPPEEKTPEITPLASPGSL